MDTKEETTKRKEIYTYQAPWTTYALGWSRKTANADDFRLAVGSFKEEYSNQVSVIEMKREDEGADFKPLTTFDHPYPATKVMWSPTSYTGSTNELLATTGDYLRIWSYDQEKKHVELKSLLNNNRHTDYCAPLTSFDWSDEDPSMLGTCSIDTTCTMWDVTKLCPKTQLIAHDKEVYDIAFAAGGAHVFGTVGADGSVRMFDLRSLEHSTILYETADLSPLLRIAWNRQDPNYLATVLTQDSKVVVLDIRMPSVPVVELVGHRASVNSLAWAPHSSSHLCTGGDDSQALIWDISIASGSNAKEEDPILAYSAAGEINQLQWDGAREHWVGIAFNNAVQVLRV